MNTPQLRAGGASGNLLKEFLSAPLPKAGTIQTTYVAGSKALDSLAKLIASTESFFHPSNSGTWTADVGHDL
jgi:proteasome activator subunit 4